MALARAAPPIDNNLGMILCEQRRVFVHNEECSETWSKANPILLVTPTAKAKQHMIINF